MDMYAAFSMKVIEPFPFEWIQWKFVSVVIIQRQTVFQKITRYFRVRRIYDLLVSEKITHVSIAYC